MMRLSVFLPVLAALLLGPLMVRPAFALGEVERPFLLWTAGDIEKMQQRLENDPDYARIVEQTLADPEGHERHLLALWRYAVKGDEEAGAQQKARLLRVARSAVPRGAAQWQTVLRYDLLYDELSEDERQEVEQFFRTYIDHGVFRNSLFDREVFNDERNYSRYHAHYHRLDNWLPNITFPRVLSANLMAAALADEELIRKVWDHYGSWRWYFDEYLTDGGFYGEEFGKHHALPGEKLLYCIALDNLGLGELGFDYRGRHGSTMRGHIETNFWLGFPAVELHTGRPHFPRMIIGDLRGGRFTVFQDALVGGYFPDGRGGTRRWASPGAWGGEIRGNHPQWDGYTGFTPKMQIPLWFEISHRKWPNAGFDYFLAQMRGPDDEAYQPTIYFGLEPIHPDQVRPPRAPSWVAERRGLAMLRAEESPDYWESPAPAVGLRLATPYAHDVYDNFALTGFYAFNRQIYINRQIGGYARHWTRSILSHAGVKVDAAEPAFTEAATARFNFQDALKFTAVRSREVYPDIDATRGLFLTDHYLLDVFSLVDEEDKERTFRWVVHPLGIAELDDRWSEPQPLTGELGHEADRHPHVTTHRLLPEDPQELLDSFGEARVRWTDEDWHLRVVQDSPIPEADRAMDPAWFARRIGVDLRMAAEADTAIAVADTPVAHFDPQQRPDPADSPEVYEVGGASIIVQRTAPRAIFAALHEPFEDGAGDIATFTEIARGDEWGAWRIGGAGEPVNDRAYLRFDHDRTTVTVEDDRATVTFTDHALVRISEGKVEVFGDVRSIRIELEQEDVRYYHNGRLSPATIEDGVLTYDRVHGGG